MTPMKKIALIVACGLISGCLAQRLPTQDQRMVRFAVVQNTFEISRAGLAFIKSEAARNKQTDRCVAATLAESILAASVEGFRNDFDRIPAIAVDISPCIETWGGLGEAERIGDLVTVMTQSSLNMAEIYYVQVHGYTDEPDVCREAAKALTTIRYMKGAIPVVVEELRAGNGAIGIPGQQLAVEECS